MAFWFVYGIFGDVFVLESFFECFGVFVLILFLVGWFLDIRGFGFVVRVRE